MSQEFINKLLIEAYKITNDAFGRQGVDAAKQEITITRGNLKHAYKEAFSIEHSKEFPNRDSPFETDKVFNKAATAGFKALLNHLERGSSHSTIISRSADKVVFSQPKNLPRPFNILKQAGIQVIQEELNALGRAPLSKEQEVSIQTGIHRLHTSTTVGLARLAYTLNYLNQEMLLHDFFSSRQYKRIEDKYGDLTAEFEIIEGAENKKDFIRAINVVKLHVASRSKNFAGSESRDWKIVWPKLEKELRTWGKQHNWVDQKGSKSIKDKSKLKLEALVLEAFAKVPKVKIRGGVAVIGSMARKPQKRVYKGKTGPPPKKSKVSSKFRDPNTGRFISKPQVSSPFNLMALINAKLPSVVAANMGIPKLVYRTGRFAGSTKVVDVQQTPKGFLSLGYTYQKYPYQTFEPGYAQGSPERDPRTLIDKSIREIATTIALGRITTRRI